MTACRLLLPASSDSNLEVFEAAMVVTHVCRVISLLQKEMGGNTWMKIGEPCTLLLLEPVICAQLSIEQTLRRLDELPRQAEQLDSLHSLATALECSWQAGQWVLRQFFLRLGTCSLQSGSHVAQNLAAPCCAKVCSTRRILCRDLQSPHCAQGAGSLLFSGLC